MTNEQMFVNWANNHGIIEKAEGGIVDISTVNFGGIIPQPLVEEMISLTRTQSRWLGNIDTRIRARQSGNVPVTDWNEPATEYVGRNDGTKVTTRPPTWNVPYNCKKLKSEFFVTTEELREAVQAGISNFETKMLADWATQLGNDIATLAIQGDASLDQSSRLNRLLRATDGVDIKTDAGANVFDAAGQSFGQGMFAAMLDYMPDRFAEDQGLAWLFNRRVNTHWHDSLTNVNTTERMRSALGDRALTTEVMVPPLGINQLIVPQIKSNNGPTAVAPTSATASGNGIDFDLSTLIPSQIATVALGVGRRILCTYLPSGLTETVLAYDDTELTCLTVGKLGQDTVSTTAADYSVRVADETEVYLSNPKGLVLVYCNEWRSYREFNKDFDRFEVTTYVEADILVPMPESMVKFKRVRISPITTWT
jgi:hypothetical protein